MILSYVILADLYSLIEHDITSEGFENYGKCDENHSCTFFDAAFGSDFASGFGAGEGVDVDSVVDAGAVVVFEVGDGTDESLYKQKSPDRSRDFRIKLNQ